MLRRLMETDDDLAKAIVRLLLGVVIFPHGAQKLLGWFGGHGFNETLQFFTGPLRLPLVIAFLVILIEFFGGLGLIIGFLGRVSALGVLAVMLGAIFTIHLQHGFFMNWYGTQQGEGFEYHLLAIGMALAILAGGSGRLSVDRSVTRGAAAARDLSE